MKHKVKVWVETEKDGFFGKKKVKEEKTVWVDDRTYKEMRKKQREDDLFSIDEQNFYDMMDD